jgi:hypothetical protein
MLALLLCLPVTANAEPVTYNFTLIADNTGPISGSNSNIFPSINSEGTVAFQAFLRNGGEGIFTGGGGPLTTIATNAPPSPISQFGPGQFSGPSINDGGTVAFSAVLVGGGFGIFTGGGGPLTTIADTSGPFSSFQGTAINNSGVVAFGVDLKGGGSQILTASGGAFSVIADTGGLFGGVSINNRGTVAFVATNPISAGSGLFTGNGGPLTTIVATNLSPFFQIGGISLNDRGTVAFEGFFSQAGGIGIGIFTGNGGPITTIADTSGPFSNFFSPSINNAGEVAFQASLNAGGAGIFTGPDPVSDKVIALGDALFGSTVRAIEFGGGRSLNDAGQIVFDAFLADGREVIARAQVVPEPSSLAMGSTAALLGLGYAWRLRVQRARWRK